jgi:hypothetical protein
MVLKLVVVDLSYFVALLVALFCALELGYRSGLRASQDQDARSGGQVGAIQGALLGLLGLLLAFSFSAAGTRFLERQDLITEEANAIGTSYLRTDLLPEPQRSELRSLLKRYTEHRIEVATHFGGGWNPVPLAEAEALHGEIWRATMAGIAERRETLLALVNPINEVIDLHTVRVAAAKKRIPKLVLALLVACSMLSIAVIGYGCGMGGRRRAPMTVPLAAIIAASLWITFDLDNPRRGLLQLSDAPLQALKFDAP